MANLPSKGHRVRAIRPIKDPSKVRISTAVKTAIHEMIHNGRTRSESALIAGIKDDSLYRALTKPEVLRYKNEIMRVFRESESERSFTKIVSLRDDAKSENVQLDAAKTIASMDDRFQTGQKITHAGNINVKSVGYIIDLRDMDTIDAQDQSDHVPSRDVIDVQLDQ